MTIRTPSRFFTVVTRRRWAAGSYVAGAWVDGALTEDLITVSVQPVSGEDLARLPEGVRTRDSIRLFTDDDLRTANEASGYAADQVEHDDEWYEVVAVDSFSMGQMDHLEVLAFRVDRTGLDFASSPA